MICWNIVRKKFEKNQEKFRVKKVIKRKGEKLYIKWKVYHSSFNNWIDKKDIVQMSEYSTETKSFGGREKVELDLPNFATKGHLKNATIVDTSKFAKKIDLASLKSEVDKLDIDKLEKVPTHLSSLKNIVVKLDVDKLVPVIVDLRKLSDVVKSDFV